MGHQSILASSSLLHLISFCSVSRSNGNANALTVMEWSFVWTRWVQHYGRGQSAQLWTQQTPHLSSSEGPETVCASVQTPPQAWETMPSVPATVCQDLHGDFWGVIREGAHLHLRSCPLGDAGVKTTGHPSCLPGDSPPSPRRQSLVGLSH